MTPAARIAILEAKLAEVKGHFQSAGVMIDHLLADIDQRDVTIDGLREQLARMTIERDGTHECNVRLFDDKARLIRQMTAMQAGH